MVVGYSFKSLIFTVGRFLSCYCFFFFSLVMTFARFKNDFFLHLPHIRVDLVCLFFSNTNPLSHLSVALAVSDLLNGSSLIISVKFRNFFENTHIIFFFFPFFQIFFRNVYQRSSPNQTNLSLSISSRRHQL